MSVTSTHFSNAYVLHITSDEKKSLIKYVSFDEIKSDVKEGISLLFSGRGNIVRNIMTIISIGTRTLRKFIGRLPFLHSSYMSHVIFMYHKKREKIERSSKCSSKASPWTITFCS